MIIIIEHMKTPFCMDTKKMKINLHVLHHYISLSQYNVMLLSTSLFAPESSSRCNVNRNVIEFVTDKSTVDTVTQQRKNILLSEAKK